MSLGYVWLEWAFQWHPWHKDFGPLSGVSIKRQNTCLSPFSLLLQPLTCLSHNQSENSSCRQGQIIQSSTRIKKVEKVCMSMWEREIGKSVYVCLCVCVRERERERERERKDSVHVQERERERDRERERTVCMLQEREREREKRNECICLCECVSLRQGEECACVCVRERKKEERMWMCVWEREREKKITKTLCVSVRENS